MQINQPPFNNAHGCLNRKNIYKHRSDKRSGEKNLRNPNFCLN